jgi:hypothetical protein
MKDFDPSVKFDESIDVSVTTIDSMIKQFGLPQFCKIDVEGYEEQVLLGLSTALTSLSFEFFPTTLHRAVTCIDILKHLGEYTYNWSFTESFKFQNNNWLSAFDMKGEILKYKGRKSGDIYAILSKRAL